MLEEIIKSGFAEWQLPLTEEMLRSYRIYADALMETNRVMNLTAIEGEEDTARLHFLDSVALLRDRDLSGKTLIDVGTGAGFPGLALKIACPDLQLTLLDSLDKRIGFLRRTCDMLEAGDVSCLHARAEEIPSGMRENFDFAVSRAVARLQVLSELCLPYVKPGGLFIAMKGPDVEEELEEAKPAIKKLGGKTEKVEPYRIPGTEVTHSLVLIRKIAPTPPNLPRKWAQIKKKPL